jgi:sugar/nucleoside kinase (ribokinase family)
MSSTPLLSFVIAGSLHRNFIITSQGQALFDVPGGGLWYAAVGMAIWENGIGLVGRAGEDYPQEWLVQLARRGFDTRGIYILPEAVDLRHFIAYEESDSPTTDNPVAQYARLGLSYPKAMLGYTPPTPYIDSRTRPGLLTIRQTDIPADYLDATAAHLCPMDYLTHTLMPSVLRRGNIHTLTMDPGSQYMTPTFWEDIPVLVNGLNAFLCSESKVRSLFQGRSTDLWEMAETLSGYGCETVVIKRGGRGQYLYNAHQRMRWVIPAYPVQVVDPTGGGDAFCGGFLAGYRSSYDPLYAALTGCVSAAMVIEGTHPLFALDALPGLAKARLDALKEMVHRA